MMTSFIQQNSYTIFNFPIDLTHLLLPGLEQNWEEERKLEELRSDIGEELFSLISEGDRQFIIETEGMIDLGHKFAGEDFKRIEKSLREDYEY